MSELKLTDVPNDTISSLCFAPRNPKLLLASSWDGFLRLYDLNDNSVRVECDFETPILDCCFQDSVQTFTAGLDNTVSMFNCNTNSKTLIGQHDAPIKSVEYFSDLNVVLTGSWDSNVKIWDWRTPGSATTLPQSNKVYTMSMCGNRLIVGTAGRKVLIWDLRNPGSVEQRRDSSLKYQTRCLKAFPSQQGYVLGSIEGRVAVEYLDPSPEIQKKKYAFKCHRVKENEVEKIYPVNCLAFHNIHNTFATGGSDCFVNIWDGFNKKRLCQFSRLSACISALSFDENGDQLAIASSQIFDENEPQTPTEANIYIKQVTDHETKPK